MAVKGNKRSNPNSITFFDRKTPIVLNDHVILFKKKNGGIILEVNNLKNYKGKSKTLPEIDYVGLSLHIPTCGQSFICNVIAVKDIQKMCIQNDIRETAKGTKPVITSIVQNIDEIVTNDAYILHTLNSKYLIVVNHDFFEN